MNRYLYNGLEAFGEDRGTFCPPSAAASKTFDTDAFDDAALTREINQRADGRPIIWFVDDERANREWFRDHHRESFTTVTFSSHANFRRALARGLPGNAFVTDIFFPATPVASEAQAAELLAVYDAISIARCRISASSGPSSNIIGRWTAFKSPETGRPSSRLCRSFCSRARLPFCLGSRTISASLGQWPTVTG